MVLLKNTGLKEVRFYGYKPSVDVAAGDLILLGQEWYVATEDIDADDTVDTILLSGGIWQNRVYTGYAELKKGAPIYASIDNNDLEVATIQPGEEVLIGHYIGAEASPGTGHEVQFIEEGDGLVYIDEDGEGDLFLNVIRDTTVAYAHPDQDVDFTKGEDGVAFGTFLEWTTGDGYLKVLLAKIGEITWVNNKYLQYNAGVLTQEDTSVGSPTVTLYTVGQVKVDAGVATLINAEWDETDMGVAVGELDDGVLTIDDEPDEGDDIGTDAGDHVYMGAYGLTLDDGAGNGGNTPVGVIHLRDGHLVDFDIKG